MSNCGFIQLSTFFEVQKLLTQEFYNSPSTSGGEFLANFLKGPLTEYVKSSLNQHIDINDSTYITGALNKALNILDRVAPNPILAEVEFIPTFVQSSVNNALDRIAVILANNISSPGTNTVREDFLQETTFGGNLEAPKNIDITMPIKNPGDISKMFYGAFNAQTRLTSTFSGHLMRRFLINKNGERYNITDAEVDESIKTYKQEIFKALVDHVNKETKSKLDNRYYKKVDKSKAVNEDMPNILKAIADYYQGLNVNGKKIEAWEASNTAELEHYMNYITLSNFDYLLTIYGSNVYSIADATFNSFSETLETKKYSLNVTSNITGGFNADELYALADEQTSIYKRFIESMKLVDTNGKIASVNRLDISSVNATIARVFQDVRDLNRKSIVYDKSNPLHSMQEIFEFFIKNHFTSPNNFNVGERPYSSGEKEAVLSVYLNFFGHSNIDLEKLVGTKLYKALTTKNENGVSSMDIIGKSSYQLSLNTNNAKLNTQFSPVNILVSNFNKTYFNNYTQIVYSLDKKGLVMQTLENQIFEGDVIWLKNTIDGTANLPVGTEGYKKMMEGVKADPENGIVTFSLNGGIKLEVNLDKDIISVSKNNKVIHNTADSSLELFNNPLFLKLVENAIGIDFSNKNLMSALLNQFDPMGGAVETTSALLRLAAGGIFLRTIANTPIISRSKFVSDNLYLSNRKAMYDADFDEYNLAGVYSKANPDATNIAKAISTINGSLYKAVVKTANGKNMPLHAEVRHIYVVQDMIDQLLKADSPTHGASPIKNNLFVKNRGLLKSPVIRTFIKDGESVKHSSKMSPLEHTTVAIMHEYLGALNTSNGKAVYIQPTVFTDKNMHYSIPIDMTSKVTVVGKDGNPKDIILGTSSPEVLLSATYQNSKNYHENLAIRILVPYITALRNAYTLKEGLDPNKHKVLTPGLTFNKRNVHESLKEVNQLMGQLTPQEFKDAFYATHGNNYALMDELGFKTKPEFGLSESLLGMMNVLETPDKFIHYMDKVKALFIRDLNDMKFQMEFYDIYGNITPTFDGLLGKMDTALKGGLNEAEFIEAWVDPSSGYIINTKEVGGKTVLNPLLENFFLMDNFISDSFQQVSMGSIHSHPTKGTIPKGVSSDERFMHVLSLKGKASLKRQLAGTPGKPINQGLITGSTSDLNIVSITDVDLPTFNSYGIEDKMTVTDGVKLTPMLQINLQNNSFQDNQAGLNQKTLSNDLDTYYNQLDQDKCAEHAMTNEMSRRSINGTHSIKDLYAKAYGIPFNAITPNGQSLNIFRGYDGKVITLDNIAPEGVFYGLWNPGTEKYDVIKVLEVIPTVNAGSSMFTDNTEYTVKAVNLSTRIPLVDQKVSINNLYDLWNVLGGDHSLSQHDEGFIQTKNSNYVFSDASHKTLTNFVNAIGVWTTQKELSTQGIDPAFMVARGKNIIANNNGRFPTQNEVWQPLKDSFIHSFAFHSVEKSGGKSTQPINTVFSKDGITPIYFKQNVISTLLLLNSEHSVEDSELTEMSQIVSALAFNSETPGVATVAYTTISKLVDLKLRKFLNGIEEFKQFNSSDTLYKEITNFLIRQFKSNDQKTIATLLANLAENAQRNHAVTNDGEATAIQSYLGSNMPLSSYIYDQFISMFVSSINRGTIKRKYTGAASVLKTSGTFVQVYDVQHTDGTHSSVLGDVFHTKHAGEITTKPVSLQEVKMFQWVQLGIDEPIYLDSSRKLLNFKRAAKLSGEPIVRVYGKPRELKPLEVNFNVTNAEGVTHSMSIYDTMEFEIVLGLMDLADPNNPKRGPKTEEAQLIMSDPVYMARVQEILGTHKPSHSFYKNNAKLIQLSAKKEIQRIYRGIEKNHTINIYDPITKTVVAHAVSNIETIPGEAIGPNLYRKQFGLPEGISLSSITPQTFIDILTKNSFPKAGTEAAESYFRHLDGNHIYIFSESQRQAMPQRFLSAENRIKTIDGKKWVIDNQDNKVYNVDGVEYLTYVTAGGEKVNAIVVPDFDPTAEQGVDAIGDFMKANSFGRKGIIRAYTGTSNKKKLTDKIASDAQKIYASFKASTEFVAARIPGQGPQSFTALRLVDFMHEGNTIMTNHFTTWLKGEDYDIDKGFWLGISVEKNGLVSGWSSKFDYTTPESLRASLMLPVPEGVVKPYNLSIDEAVETPGSYIIGTEEANILLVPGMTKEKAELLNSIGNSSSYFINLEQGQEESAAIIRTYIDEFFGETLDEDSLEEAYKNKIARSMYDMITATLNQVHAESPISFDDFLKHIETVEPKIVSPNSFTTKAIIQEANMAGKAVVGIAAVGLKVWSALSYWGNQKLIEGKVKDMLVAKNYTINGKPFKISTIANLNFNNGKTMVDFLAELGAALQAKKSADDTIDVDAFLAEYEKGAVLSEDQSLIISQVLSAATDNAKELILQVVNGGETTAGIYIYLSMLNVPLPDIIQLMTNKDIVTITELSKQNIFDKSSESNNIDSAYKYWSEGPELFRESLPVEAKYLEREYRKIILDMPIAWTKAQRNMILGYNEKYKFPMSLTIPNVKELLNLKPEDQDAGVITFLNTIKSKLQKYSPQTETIFDENREIVEVPEEIEEAQARNVKVTSFASSRFIDKLINYYNTIGKNISPQRIKTVDNFMKIAKDADEITLLGGILSINQGIKSDSYAQYSFFRKFNDRFYKRFDDAMDEKKLKSYSDFDLAKSNIKIKEELQIALNISPEEANTLYLSVLNSFSFEKYIDKINDGSDPMFVEASKIIYNNLKQVVNILDIVDTVPQYKQMLKASITTDNIINITTLRKKSVDNIVKEVFRKSIFAPAKITIKGVPNIVHDTTLSEEVYDKIHKAVNDILIVKWMRSLKERGIITATLYEETIINKGGMLEKISHPEGKLVTINLGTTLGRANFLTIFSKMVLDLKLNPQYADNSFIKNLGTDKEVDRLTGTKYKFWRLPMNLMNVTEHNINEFNTYVTDFNRLSAPTFGNNSIKDLFFIYNMLIHRDIANKSSFSKLFEKDTSLSEGSLFFNYINTVAHLDQTGEFLKEGVDYNIEDLLSRGVSTLIDDRKKSNADSTYVGDFAHKRTKKGDAYITTYFKWDNKAYNKISYIAEATMIPLSIDFPANIEVRNKMREDLQTQFSEAFNKIASNIENITINCK